MKTIIVALLLCLNIAYSQNSCFNVLFEDYNISAVTDDHQFIWVGTFNNGLIAYNKDTSEITAYNISNSAISSNTILSVLKSNNRLYVSSENSLMMFLNNSFEEISTTIQGVMAIAPNGNLAVAAPYEFNMLDLDNQITYTKDLLDVVTPSCCGTSTDLEYDENGRLWISNYAFYEFDVVTYDGLNWDVHDVNNSILPIESFYAFNRLTTHNDVVLATSNGATINMYENDLWSLHPAIFNEEDNIDGMLINAIEFDLEGDLWIAAGDYNNTTSGKIAFKYQDEWNFIDDELSDLPGVNVFKESQYDANIMYAASNDGLLIINKDCLRLSTEEYKYNSDLVSVFPNPASGNLNIKIKNSQFFSFQLINSLGQIVLSETDVLNNSIDISKVASGFYNLVIEVENTIVNKKVLKLNE